MSETVLAETAHTLQEVTPYQPTEQGQYPTRSHQPANGRLHTAWIILRPRYVQILRFLFGTRLRTYRTFWVMVLLFMGLTVWYHSSVSTSNAGQVAELSKVMILPREQPQIATVTDAEALRAQQPFYTNVIAGDVLFVFPLAGKAILYRPHTHQIVNAGPINLPKQ